MTLRVSRRMLRRERKKQMFFDSRRKKSFGKSRNPDRNLDSVQSNVRSIGDYQGTNYSYSFQLRTGEGNRTLTGYRERFA